MSKPWRRGAVAALVLNLGCADVGGLYPPECEAYVKCYEATVKGSLDAAYGPSGTC